MHDPPDLLKQSGWSERSPSGLLDLTGQCEAPDFGLVLHISGLGPLPIAIELLKC
jgi:hypothetical protein